jgi:hypothetical protein
VEIGFFTHTHTHTRTHTHTHARTLNADVEIGFFARWWDEQPEDRRNVTRGLVANGQLEFINGAWCMHGEAHAAAAAAVDVCVCGGGGGVTCTHSRANAADLRSQHSERCVYGSAACVSRTAGGGQK